MAAKKLNELGLDSATVVPVPSSSCTSFSADTCPIRLATALQAETNGKLGIGLWLHFDQVMPRSRKGGTRSSTVLRNHLVVSPDVRKNPVILLDDVKTTGAHIRACAAALREAGAAVETAVVAARTVQQQHPHSFKLIEEDLEDWDF